MSGAVDDGSDSDIVYHIFKSLFKNFKDSDIEYHIFKSVFSTILI